MNFQRGFTLMETIIVVALFAVVMTVLLNMFDRHGALYRYEQAQMNVSGGIRSTFNEVNLYITQAHRVVDSRTIGATVYTTGPTTVVLQIPAIDGSGNIIANTWDYVVFSLTGQSLSEITQPDAASVRKAIARQLSDVISSLTFSYDSVTMDDVRKVTVDVQAAQQVRAQTVTNHVTQAIYLRNY